MSEEVHETPSTTPNFQTELAAQIAELMPEVIADGKVDMEKLKELLDGDAADTSERFGLFWPGKKRALRAAQEPTTATLRPDFENSKDWDTTKNVFIEGDNLEVLKILQKHYHAKIKMIYIDPPYNTGKDFVYPDNYKEGLDTYLEWTRQVNEEGKKLSTNADTEGRYHSNWLNMMYPRLKLARNLLTQDGIIFVSIDDNEQDNLRKLCNEVFGESNFIASFMWKRKKEISSDTKNVAVQGEYILAYGRSSDALVNPEPISEEYVKSAYKEPTAEFPEGRWRPVPITVSKGLKGGGYEYDIHTPGGTVHRRLFAYPKKSYEELVARGRVYFGKNGDGVPQRVIYAHESKGRPTTNYWADVATNKEGKKEIIDLFGDNVFDTPKPTALVQKMLSLAVGPEDIILDFFAGSGTTAHAVMLANAADAGHRSFISVQLPEPTPEGSVARREGYATVADIARDRILRVGQTMSGDSGFRSYRLADTNFSKWKLSSDVDRTELEQHLFDLRESSNSDDASADDLLAEILLKQGYSLTERIAPVDVAGLDLRSVGDGIVLAYLNEHVKPTLEQLRAVVDEDPARLIVLDVRGHDVVDSCRGQRGWRGVPAGGMRPMVVVVVHPHRQGLTPSLL